VLTYNANFCRSIHPQYFCVFSNRNCFDRDWQDEAILQSEGRVFCNMAKFLEFSDNLLFLGKDEKQEHATFAKTQK